MTDRIASQITYAASGSAVILGLDAAELAAIVGALVAVLTFAVNLWFKAQHLKIARNRAHHLDDDTDVED